VQMYIHVFFSYWSMEDELICIYICMYTCDYYVYIYMYIYIDTRSRKISVALSSYT
jgi:hypothetical protein